MKLIDLLNKANKSRKIPMYVWDVYVSKRRSATAYVKRAYFNIESFDCFEEPAIRRYMETEAGKKYGKTLVEIDHLEEDDMKREIILFLKIGNEVWVDNSCPII
jgi:hypothetical protein